MIAVMFAALGVFLIAAVVAIAVFLHYHVIKPRAEDEAEDAKYAEWLAGQNRKRREELHHEGPPPGPPSSGGREVPGPVERVAKSSPRAVAPAPGPGANPKPWRTRCHDPGHEHQPGYWGDDVTGHLDYQGEVGDFAAAIAAIGEAP